MKRALCSLVVAVVVAMSPSRAQAQSSTDKDRPLGDVARELRNSKKAPLPIITNDNLADMQQLIRQTERRAFAAGLILSNEASAPKPQPTDITCNLSFSARNSSLAKPEQQDLPEDQIAKLDGPAVISADNLQLSIYNGTSWQLQEITVGLTIVKRENRASAALTGPHLVPAIAADTPLADAPTLKRPDVTLLYHLKGTAAPFSTASFTEPLGITLAADQEWHWAILQARGIPPQQ